MVGLADMERVAVIVTTDLLDEIDRAWAKFGSQIALPDGTSEGYAALRDSARNLVDVQAHRGTSNWYSILREEIYEAAAETDPALLRAELLQVAAVAIRWVAAIDARSESPEGAGEGEAPAPSADDLREQAYDRFVGDER